MTDFDELVGGEPVGSERERLHAVHDLLVQAGPPPELPPEIAKGPTLAMTFGRVRRATHGRKLLIATLAAAVLAGLIVGFSHPGNPPHFASIPMRGTAWAPNATATLEIPPTTHGKQRMQLEVKGLPPLAKGRYVVYLVRNGQPVAPCGSFTVASGAREQKVALVSPYALQATDTWIVTEPTRSGIGMGLTVLKPVT